MKKSLGERLEKKTYMQSQNLLRTISNNIT